jgi:hypothetical protein
MNQRSAPRRLGAVIATVAALAGCADGGTGPAPGRSLVVVGGDRQVAIAGTALPVPLAVRLQGGSSADEQALVWDASGAGSLALADARTDGTGLATARLDLGTMVGARQIRVSLADDPSVAAHFTVTALAPSLDPVAVAEVPIQPNYGIHDTYVRDGIAFVCAWNSGVIIYDVGGWHAGGSPSNPVPIGSLTTSDDGVPGGPAVHNAWWFHNPASGEARYLFIGQEGPATIGSVASGDLHVVDVSDLTQPREVAFFHRDGAGVHNFWMDEARQVLYAAYYNGGVVALDVSGTLSGDLAGRLIAENVVGGPGNTFTWGVQLAGGSLWASDMLSGLWRLDPVTLATLGGGDNVPERWGSDLWVANGYAYTGTWGGTTRNGSLGNVVKIWSLAGGNPTLTDSIVFADIKTVSDLQVTEDGTRLVVTTERLSGAGISVFDLADPRRPVRVGFTPVAQGLHTGTVSAIGGRTFVFAARNPSAPALVVYDITP